MVLTDMSTLMQKNGSILLFEVVTIHHDKAHPTEWRQRVVVGDTDDDAIILRMLFTLSDQ